MNRIFKILIILGFIFLPSIASAQQNLRFSSMEVDLWPEYDRPEILTIYRIALPTSTPLPVDLQLRIPAAAGAPNAVAAKQPDGSLINLTYDTQTQGNWTTISFTATTPEVQIEYYDPSLSVSGNQRQYTYNWSGDYAVDNFVVQVQQPFDATEMTISPDMGPGERGPDNLIYYTGEYGALTGGQAFTTSLSYNKASDTLTSASLSVDSIGPIDQNIEGGADWMSSLPYVLGGLGLLLLVGAGVWYFKAGRRKARQERRPRHKSASQKQAPLAAPPAGQSTSSSAGNIYCHQCGNRANPGDRFCRTCGATLRTG